MILLSYPSLDWKVIAGQFFNRRLKTAMTMESGREGDNGRKRIKRKLKYHWKILYLEGIFV